MRCDARNGTNLCWRARPADALADHDYFLAGGGSVAHSPDGGQESPDGCVSAGPLCARLGEYLKRAQVAGVFDRYDRWILRRLRSFIGKRWRDGAWRRYPDRYFWFRLGLTRRYHLRRDFVREFD